MIPSANVGERDLHAEVRFDELGELEMCIRDRLYCVNYHGGDFVLSSKKDVYRLDDQNGARVFAGQKVKIMGKMEADKKTIHVIKIEEDY